jgi:hypothetical protein
MRIASDKHLRGRIARATALSRRRRATGLLFSGLASAHKSRRENKMTSVQSIAGTLEPSPRCLQAGASPGADQVGANCLILATKIADRWHEVDVGAVRLGPKSEPSNQHGQASYHCGTGRLDGCNDEDRLYSTT